MSPADATKKAKSKEAAELAVPAQPTSKEESKAANKGAGAAKKTIRDNAWRRYQGTGGIGSKGCYVDHSVGKSAYNLLS